MTKRTSTETVLPEDRLKANKRANGFIFVIAMWLLSRLVIVVAMQVITPLLYTSPVHLDYKPLYPLDFVHDFVPKTSWALFSHWDGAWYRRIATVGYDYANDGQMHSIAFFPIFPLITRGVMTLGLRFDVAGTLVNNLAFLGAMGVLYLWAEERHGISVARWATAVLAWCPYSVFGTLTYTEGLFLLFSTAALRAFDKRQHGWAALWGAIATATRVTGLTLLPTFFLVAWREQRPAIAYAAGLAAVGGLLLFSLYCAIDFGDALAFVHVQQAWQEGPEHEFWLGRFKNALALDRPSLSRVVMLLASGYLLWYLRAKLPRVAVVYGLCSLALLLIAGSSNSFYRHAYGIVSLSLGLGMLLAHHLRWGYAIVGFFAILLVRAAIRFACWDWVG